MANHSGAQLWVTMADIHGNAIMLGSEWSRCEMPRAAEKVVLVADKIVDTDCMRQFPRSRPHRDRL